jgi:hypothetical protein
MGRARMLQSARAATGQPDIAAEPLIKKVL